MNTKHERRELRITVGTAHDQLAQVLPQITPLELIAAILEEFTEFEYLGPPADDYVLVRNRDQQPLDQTESIEQQVAAGEHLTLQERQVVSPAGTHAPGKRLYLRQKGTTRDQQDARVYKVQWMPAIIGRRGRDMADNEQVAIELGSHDSGLRVSRRHAQISEENGRFYIESLSSNLTILQQQDQSKTLDKHKLPLHHGDVIYLAQSEISLQVIVPEKGDDSNGC